jgi:hypothetical protein
MESSAMIERQETFGRGLKKEREATGKSQPYLRDLLGLPLAGGQSTISKLENDKIPCRRSWYIALVNEYPNLRNQPLPEQMVEDAADVEPASPAASKAAAVAASMNFETAQELFDALVKQHPELVANAVYRGTTADGAAAPESNASAAEELTFESAAEAIGAIVLAGAGALEGRVAFVHEDDQAELEVGGKTYSGTLVEVVQQAGAVVKKRVASLKLRSTRADALLQKVPAACT